MAPLPPPPPLWLSLSAGAIRALPFGRYRLGNAVSRWATRPFVAQMPSDVGSPVFVCDLRDSIAREVCFTGRYEPQETQIAMRLLKPGMRVVDVGANWGYFTLLCANLVTSAGRVLALEPHPRLHALLTTNVEANGLSQVVCRPLAAGAGPGRVALVDFRETDGNWGLSRTTTSGGDFECEVAAVDTLLDHAGWDRVDVIKIDVEGAEADVLRGMRHGLDRGRYGSVLLEVHPSELALRGGSSNACVELLRCAGYQGWRIDHSPVTHRQAAARQMAVADLVRPFDRPAPTESWPHQLWLAPGQTLPD